MLHGIVTSHGFTDGNKRTALYLVELLIERSGYEFVENDLVIAETIMSVALGETDYRELEKWFKQRLTRLNTLSTVKQDATLDSPQPGRSGT